MAPPDWIAVASSARAVLAAADGVAHITAFLAAGLSRHQVAALFRQGDLVRPRIGWYADPALPFEAIRAIRIGGVLGGASAAASYGLPLPEGADDDLQVNVAGNASRLRHSRDRTRQVAAGDEPGVRLLWQPRIEAARGYRVAVVDALLQLALCVPFDWLVAAMDAALRVPRRGGPDLRRVVGAAAFGTPRAAAGGVRSRGRTLGEPHRDDRATRPPPPRHRVRPAGVGAPLPPKSTSSSADG